MKRKLLLVLFSCIAGIALAQIATVANVTTLQGLYNFATGPLQVGGNEIADSSGNLYDAALGANTSGVCTTAGGELTNIGCNIAPKASPTFTGTVTMPLTTAGVVTTTAGGVLSSAAGMTAAHQIAVADMSNIAYTNGQVIVYYDSPVAQTIPTNGTTTVNGVSCATQFYLTTATTAATTFTISYASTWNGTYSQIGTIAFLAGTKISPTITITTQAIVQGGAVKIAGPATADATAAGLVGSICTVY